MVNPFIQNQATKFTENGNYYHQQFWEELRSSRGHKQFYEPGSTVHNQISFSFQPVLVKFKLLLESEVLFNSYGFPNSFICMATILKACDQTEQASELMIEGSSFLQIFYVTNLTLLKQQEKFNMLSD